MPRSHARVKTSIWRDADFTRRSALAQRVYLIALSQPEINLAGVVPFTARRWARYACDTKPGDINDAIAELEAAGFVLLDEDTEELWVRSFVKHDGILGNDKLIKGATTAAASILSERIRDRIRMAYPMLLPNPETGSKIGHGIGHQIGHGIGEPEDDSLWITTSGSEKDSPDPHPHPRTQIQDPHPLPPSGDEDEESLRTEAKRRLAERVTNLGPVGDEEAWLRKTESGLREVGWRPPSRSRTDFAVGSGVLEQWGRRGA